MLIFWENGKKKNLFWVKTTLKGCKNKFWAKNAEIAWKSWWFEEQILGRFPPPHYLGKIYNICPLIKTTGYNLFMTSVTRFGFTDSDNIKDATCVSAKIFTLKGLKYTHPVSSHRSLTRRSHIITHYRCGYSCWSSCDSTLLLLHCALAPVGVAKAFPKRTLTATPTCGSSQSGTMLHETYIAYKESGCVHTDVTEFERKKMPNLAPSCIGKGLRLGNGFCLCQNNTWDVARGGASDVKVYTCVNITSKTDP